MRLLFGFADVRIINLDLLNLFSVCFSGFQRHSLNVGKNTWNLIRKLSSDNGIFIYNVETIWIKAKFLLLGAGTRFCCKESLTEEVIFSSLNIYVIKKKRKQTLAKLICILHFNIV